MNDQERRYNIERQQNVLLNVLRRPIDIATNTGRWIYRTPKHMTSATGFDLNY
jgi:hypothetical protein